MPKSNASRHAESESAAMSEDEGELITSTEEYVVFFALCTPCMHAFYLSMLENCVVAMMCMCLLWMCTRVITIRIHASMNVRICFRIAQLLLFPIELSICA